MEQPCMIYSPKKPSVDLHKTAYSARIKLNLSFLLKLNVLLDLPRVWKATKTRWQYGGLWSWNKPIAEGVITKKYQWPLWHHGGLMSRTACFSTRYEEELWQLPVWNRARSPLSSKSAWHKKSTSLVLTLFLSLSFITWDILIPDPPPQRA